MMFAKELKWKHLGIWSSSLVTGSILPYSVVKHGIMQQETNFFKRKIEELESDPAFHISVAMIQILKCLIIEYVFTMFHISLSLMKGLNQIRSAIFTFLFSWYFPVPSIFCSRKWNVKITEVNVYPTYTCLKACI
jgi:hypothetical protein